MTPVVFPTPGDERPLLFVVRLSPDAVHNALGILHSRRSFFETAAPIDAFGPADLLVVKLRDPAARLELLERIPGVLHVEPDYLYRAQFPPPTPNDPQFTTQANLNAVSDTDLNAPEAWNALGWFTQPPAKDQVMVAVLDSGIEVTPGVTPGVTASPTPRLDFRDRISTFRINVVDPTPSTDVMDENGHGTAMSGIIAAIGNNNAEVAGLAWGTTIVPCKMAAADTADLVASVRCLRWVSHLVRDEHLPITAVNFSYTTDQGCSCELENEIRNLRALGVLFVTATADGYTQNNDLTPTGPCPVFPAANRVSNIIAVTMSDMFDNVAGGAGKRSVHVAAPGSNIRVLWKEGSVNNIIGTSPATAQVTGLIALLKAQDQSRDWRALRNLAIAGGVVLTATPQKQTISNRRIRAWDDNGVSSMNCNGQLVRRRLLPVEDAATVKAGDSVRLRAISLNCASPMPVPVWVTQAAAPIANPTPAPNFFLKDDGQPPDEVDGDGEFDALWTPPAGAGNTYTLRFWDPQEPTLNSETLTVTVN